MSLVGGGAGFLLPPRCHHRRCFRICFRKFGRHNNKLQPARQRWLFSMVPGRQAKVYRAGRRHRGACENQLARACCSMPLCARVRARARVCAHTVHERPPPTHSQVRANNEGDLIYIYLFSECEKNHFCDTFCADLDVLFNTISHCTMHHPPSHHSAMLCSSCRGSRGLREPVRTSSERLVERTRTYLALS